MLDDLDKSLEKILTTRGSLGSDIDVSFEQPSREWSARISRPTISCYCFDLRENLKLRSNERFVARDERTGRVTFAPRRFDITYLITAWTRKIEDEHRLLWRTLATLKPVTLLKPAEMVGSMRSQRYDVPVFVADMSEGRLNLVDLWTAIDNQMRLGFTAQFTIDLDSQLVIEAPLVLEAVIRMGRSDNPGTKALSEQDVEVRHPKDQPDTGGKAGADQSNNGHSS